MCFNQSLTHNQSMFMVVYVLDSIMGPSHLAQLTLILSFFLHFRKQLMMRRCGPLKATASAHKALYWVN